MPTPLQRYLHLLTHYLKPQWHRVLLLAALLVAGALLQVYTPRLVRRFLDTALNPSISGSLPTLAATNRLRTDLTSHCTLQHKHEGFYVSPGSTVSRKLLRDIRHPGRGPGGEVWVRVGANQYVPYK